MLIRNTTVDLEASRYFLSLRGEVERAILHRIRTVPLVKGRAGVPVLKPGGAANDNAQPPAPDPTGAGYEFAVPEAPHDASDRGSSADGSTSADARETCVGLRTLTASDVRATMVNDQGLHAEIFNAVHGEYLHAVRRGTPCGQDGRALIFHVVKCVAIKHVRRYARGLLRRVVTSNGSTVSDHLHDASHERVEHSLDRVRALGRLRAVVDSLSDEERELLDAKLDETLHAYALARGELPGSVRCRAKRLYDWVVDQVRSAA